MAKSSTPTPRKANPKRRKTGGRRPGTLNQKTMDVREGLIRALDVNSDNLKVWLDRVAEGIQGLVILPTGDRVTGWVVKPDPARACEILLNMVEYRIPKLARTEVVGEGGGPVVLKIVEEVTKA